MTRYEDVRRCMSLYQAVCLSLNPYVGQGMYVYVGMRVGICREECMCRVLCSHLPLRGGEV